MAERGLQKTEDVLSDTAFLLGLFKGLLQETSLHTSEALVEILEDDWQNWDDQQKADLNSFAFGLVNFVASKRGK